MKKNRIFGPIIQPDTRYPASKAGYPEPTRVITKLSSLIDKTLRHPLKTKGLDPEYDEGKAGYPVPTRVSQSEITTARGGGNCAVNMSQIFVLYAQKVFTHFIK